jgi:hypothetical protein
MSTQDDLNTHPAEFILYYCGVTHNDTTVYQMDCYDVCSFDLEGSGGNLEITSWKLLAYSQPSMATLMTYTLIDVLSFFNSFYQQPWDIVNSQSYKFTSSQLAGMRTDSSMLDMQIYNTTLQKRQYLNSSLVWTNVN